MLLNETSGGSDDFRLRMMERNPTVIPRNHHIERVIQSALDTGTFTAFHNLNSALAAPYQNREGDLEFASEPREEEKVRYTFCGT